MSLLKEIAAIPSTPKALRSFGITMGAVLALIGGVLLWRGKPNAVYFIAGAGSFAAAALGAPGALKPLNKAWMTLAVLMGFVMSRVILTVLFFAALTPIALLMRLSGKDTLALRRPADQASFWKEVSPTDRSRYDKQY